MTTKATKTGYHIRGGALGDERGMWQAWNGNTYMAGANGPMSLSAMGAFLNATVEKKYSQWGSETNPGIDWLFEPEE